MDKYRILLYLSTENLPPFLLHFKTREKHNALIYVNHTIYFHFRPEDHRRWP